MTLRNRSLPISTYRLQLSAAFNFRHAQKIVPYLHDLGITHVYASPIFAARGGSTHGYDVTDPTRINSELGGEEAFTEFTQELRRHDLGLILDIVPNHMAASPENPWWNDVLQRGKSSPYARFFDIDWDRANDKITLPILRTDLDTALQTGEVQLRLQGDALRIAVGEAELPANPDTARQVIERPSADKFDPRDRRALEDAVRAVNADEVALKRIVAIQHYALANWRDAATRLNYRRFFDINDLVGVRVHDPIVFESTHALISRLVAERISIGLRVDHIDGLRDPAEYLRRLRSLRRGLYVLVEKILEGDEELPRNWTVDGTTGYEFLNWLNSVQVNPDGQAALAGLYSQVTKDRRTFGDVVYQTKRETIQRLFTSELSTLAELLSDLGNHDAVDVEDCAEVITAVTSALSVYRTYGVKRYMSRADRLELSAALSDAKRHLLPRHSRAFAVFENALFARQESGRLPPDSYKQDEFLARWQQFTGPIMAKTLEDTVFYRYTALLSMNEVGADPGRSAANVAAFHEHVETRARRWPHALNTTATHDTKRGEDARARLNVLSEIPQVWERCIRKWMRTNAHLKDVVEGNVVPEPAMELLLYQSLLSVWPANGKPDDELRGRIHGFLTKAAREAKLRTNWTDPNVAYEAALHSFVDRLMSGSDQSPFLTDFLKLHRKTAFHGALNSLGQTFLKMAAPGVSDTYQGTEFWDTSFVDPDNRRQVDYEARVSVIDDLSTLLKDRSSDIGLRRLMSSWADGNVKLFLLARLLRARRRNPDMFLDGDYLPLEAIGERESNVVAFARRHRSGWIIAVAPRLTTRLVRAGQWPIGKRVWKETWLKLPEDAPRNWIDTITGNAVNLPDSKGDLSLFFARFPVALLESTE